MDKLYVLIGVDCDHDRKRFNRSVGKEISWIGYKTFYKHFNAIRRRILEETDLEPLLVLNIRADQQVKKSLGKYDACFDIFEEYLSKDFHQNDEIAWHNHHWRLKDNSWIQEMTDENWLRENICQSFDAIKQYNIATLHTGWCFHSTFTMNLYNDLGIKIDYSGMPKMFKSTGDYNRYDYRFVENNKIYIPSRNNYQREDTLKQNGILEVPATTGRSKFLNLLRIANNFQRAKQMNSFKMQNTHMGIAVHPFLYNIFLKNIFSQNSLKYFVTFFHSDELLPDRFKSKQASFIYRQNNIYYNLKRLILLAEEHNQLVEFINFKDFYKIYESGYFN